MGAGLGTKTKSGGYTAKGMVGRLVEGEAEQGTCGQEVVKLSSPLFFIDLLYARVT